MSQVAKAAKEHGLTGLEFAAGIPGTIGGGAVMNAGLRGGDEPGGDHCYGSQP